MPPHVALYHAQPQELVQDLQHTWGISHPGMLGSFLHPGLFDPAISQNMFLL